MRHQFRVVTAALVAVSVVALALVLARAQAPKGTAERTKWTQTKTPWGDPDLQGVWSGTTPTPLERPLDGGKVLLTDQEVESLEQELARPLGLVVVAVATLELGDVGTDQPRLVALDARVGVRQIRLACPERLDLGPGQDDPGLERLVDREVVSRPAIEGNRLFIGHEAILLDLRSPRIG